MTVVAYIPTVGLQNSILAGLRPDPAAGELIYDALPDSLVGWGENILSQFPTPLTPSASPSRRPWSRGSMPSALKFPQLFNRGCTSVYAAEALYNV